MNISNSSIQDGIQNNSGSMNIWHCEIMDKWHNDSAAGGISNFGGFVTIENCEIANNEGESAGGIYNSGEMIINSSTIGDNRAWGSGFSSGGIFNRGELTISQSIISGNNSLSGDDGGGIGNFGTLNMNRCIISGNSSRIGGGISNSGELYATNSVLIGNTANYGGGLTNQSGRTIITNSTFFNNSADKGGGIYSASGSALVITNSILWGDIADIEPEIYNSSQSAPIVSFSNIQGGYPGEGNINVNPLFVDLANDDFHLQPNSPCINTGTQNGTPSDDIDGDLRPQGAGYDIGADEYVPTIEDILVFFDESVANGNLEGYAKKPWDADMKLEKMRKLLKSARFHIKKDKIKKACKKLEKAYLRCDGENRPKDYVTGEATAVLADMINSLMIKIECK